MKILYLTNSRLPGEKAHVIQILKTCAAMSDKVDIKIVHARRTNRPWLNAIEDMKTYYNLTREISIEAIFSLDLFKFVPVIPFGKLFAYKLVFVVQTITYHISLLTVIFREKVDVYYTRDSLTAMLLVIVGKHRKAIVLYEAHYFPSSVIGVLIAKLLSNYLNGISVLTNTLSDLYIKLGFEPRRVAVIPDAVDLEDFDICSKQKARDILEIESSVFLIMYVGHMYRWKGVDTLIEAATLMSEDVDVWLVGGTPEELPRIETLVDKLDARNVHIQGYVPYYKVATYMSAADVLVVPNSGRYDISKYYTSPIKLFEYMASKRPIVAANLPSLREVVVDQETALLFNPDDPNSLAKAIRLLQVDSELSKELVANAVLVSRKYTWNNRANNILEFVHKIKAI
ncbi:MAG TPA: hypothetical protein DGM69_05865 [Chloroflexi bacterium]|nr:hypothetical protein [Chloroflexota bacterium]